MPRTIVNNNKTSRLRDHKSLYVYLSAGQQRKKRTINARRYLYVH